MDLKRVRGFAAGPFLLTALMIGLTLLSGCALFASRPLQEMSDTQAAIHAAQEVQADTLAPDYYRQALEYWEKAKREYKFKNFLEAKENSNKARELAEQAEFEAVRAGGDRSQTPPDPLSSVPTQNPATPTAE